MAAQYVGVAQETTYDTPVAPTLFIDPIEITFEHTRENLYQETVSQKEIVEQQEGVKRAQGSIQLLGDPHEFPTLFKWFYGAVTTVAAGDGLAHRHTFTPQDSMLSFTLEKGNIGTAQETQVFSGVFLTRIVTEMVARQFVTMTFDMTGSGNGSIDTTPASPSFSQVKAFWGKHVDVVIAGTSNLNVESMRLTQERRVDTDAYALGNEFLPAIEEEAFTTTLEMELAFRNWNEHKRFMSNSTTGTAWAIATSMNIQVIMTSLGDAGLTGSASAGFEKFKADFTLPKVFYDASELPVRRRDRIIQRVTATAIYDIPSAYEVQTRVWNKQGSL